MSNNINSCLLVLGQSENFFYEKIRIFSARKSVHQGLTYIETK